MSYLLGPAKNYRTWTVHCNNCIKNSETSKNEITHALHGIGSKNISLRCCKNPSFLKSLTKMYVSCTYGSSSALQAIVWPNTGVLLYPPQASAACTGIAIASVAAGPRRRAHRGHRKPDGTLPRSEILEWEIWFTISIPTTHLECVQFWWNSHNVQFYFCRGSLAHTVATRWLIGFQGWCEKKWVQPIKCLLANWIVFS